MKNVIDNGDRLVMSNFSEIKVDAQGAEYVVYLPTGVKYLLRERPILRTSLHQPKGWRKARRGGIAPTTRRERKEERKNAAILRGAESRQQALALEDRNN